MDEYVRKNGLNDYIVKKPYVDHDQAIKEMINSDILFLVIPDLEFDDILFDEPLKRVNTEVYSRVEQTKQLSKIFDKIAI